MPQLKPARSRSFVWLMVFLCLLLAAGVLLLVVGLTTQPFASPLHSSL